MSDDATLDSIRVSAVILRVKVRVISMLKSTINQ